ncbi:MAG TPA: tetratricopeptide repeat protein, partial [Phycisphaerae bacterium]
KQAAEAKSNVDVYTKISESDGVKFRGRWMPRAQVDVTIKQWTEAAKPATDLYKAGRMKDALDAVKAVLDKDSQNPDALTVGGLAAYRAANMVQARTYFTSLAASDPGNVLAENNLGVISTLQKAAAEGLLHYAKALQIAPDNRLVLDNIAEAINSYLAGNGDKNATPYKALLRQAQAAESKLEDVMAKQGFYRWGSTWVTKEQRDKLKANSDGIKEQMMKLDSQYGAIRNSLAGLENQIKQAAADIDSYTSTVSYLQGQIMLAQQRAIDSAILIAQQNTALQNIERTTRYRNQLQQQYDQVVLSTKDFLVQADRLKNAVSSGNLAGQFTGSQRIMDLGEAEKAPEPVAVADPAPLPPLPNPPTIIMQPPVPIQPPVIVPVPVVPTVFQR